MAMIKRGHQTNMPRKQHAIPENIARHIAHTRYRKVSGLSVEIGLAEMPLDAFPCTFSGNAHFFMVIAD